MKPYTERLPLIDEANWRPIKPMSRDESITNIYRLTDKVSMAEAAAMYDAGCRFIEQGE